MDYCTVGTHRIVKNRDIFTEWISVSPKKKTAHIKLFIHSVFKVDAELIDETDQKINYLCLKLAEKWKICNYSRKYFEKRFASWLDTPFTVPDTNSASTVYQSASSNKRGRPQKQFEECSLKTKKRRVDSLVHERSAAELAFAAQRSMQLSNPEKTDLIVRHMPVTDALALYLSLDLSENKYRILRESVNAFCADLFPSLYELKKAKTKFLPKAITVTETSAEVSVQQLLNTTVESILESIEISESVEVTLTCKWGFDGSSNHSMYKQKFADEEKTNEFIFFIALVPLCVKQRRTETNLWVNKRPSSPHLCRPIKFSFMKESADLIKKEEALMKEILDNLSEHVVSIADYDVRINFKMYFTMVDGSVTNILSGTNSAARCNICGATPSEMNSEKINEKRPKVENYRFGISVLHCWIRCFETLLHISYRLPFKKWQVRDSDHKIIFKKEKLRIQSEFKKQMGLNVDKVRHGYGCSNDGNTARRYFGNPQLAAKITGIDETLIENFSKILRVLSSGRDINLEKFRSLLTETKDLYLSLYSWYPMPSSTHKILLHGCDIDQSFDLAVGLLSEEALEARHKDIRNIRLSHTRKSSRVNSNADLMNYLLLSSDPLLSNKRKTFSEKSKQKIDRQSSVDEYLVARCSEPDSLLDLEPLLQLSLTEGEEDG